MHDEPNIEWATTPGLVDYTLAQALMEDRVRAIRQGVAPELVWFLEHPPLYTAGTSSSLKDLIEPARFPVYETGRGGQLTYHGPGQRVVYVMLDVSRRYRGDVRAFVSALEAWLIASLRTFSITGETRRDRVGVWVVRKPPGEPVEEKIAAIGIRIRNGVSFHGASLNVAPDLTHYGGIVPCGIASYGVTSLAALGVPATMNDVDNSLITAFESIFGPVTQGEDPAPPPR